MKHSKMKLICIFLYVHITASITSPAWLANSKQNRESQLYTSHPPHNQRNYNAQFKNTFQVSKNPKLQRSRYDVVQNLMHPHTSDAAVTKLPNSRFHQANLRRPTTLINIASPNPKLEFSTPENLIVHNPRTPPHGLKNAEASPIRTMKLSPRKKSRSKSKRKTKPNFKSKNKSKQKINNELRPIRYVNSINKELPYVGYLPKCSRNCEALSSSSKQQKSEEVPTRPAHPGERQRATLGFKYRPYVSQQKFESLDDSLEDGMGHDIFDRAKKDFAKQENIFNHALSNLQRSHNKVNSTDETNNYNDSEDTSAEEFVPYRTYAQVRKTEREEHLPSAPSDEERLTESIKDSQVHTVYTEEGYEDSSYDHVDHEKNADTTEEYADVNHQTAKTQLHHSISKSTPTEKSRKKSYKDAVIPYVTDPKIIHQLSVRSNGEMEPRTMNIVETGENIELLGADNENGTQRKKNEPLNTNLFGDARETLLVNRGQSFIDTNTKDRENRRKNKNSNISKRKLYVKNNPINAANKEQLEGNNEGNRKTTDSAKTNTSFGMKLNNTPPKYETHTITGQVSPRKYSASENLDNKSYATKNITNTKRGRRSISDDESQENSKNSADRNDEKYPYYNADSLDRNSPLRYAENPQNMPNKRHGVMAFYEQAEKTECEEVSEVDPFPKRITEPASEEKSEGIKKISLGPKLEKLGDKIDCFKAKYFGEDLLDNPLFSEGLVGLPNELFKKRNASNLENGTKFKENVFLEGQYARTADLVNTIPQEDSSRYDSIEESYDYDESESEPVGVTARAHSDTMERIAASVIENYRKPKLSDIILGSRSIEGARRRQENSALELTSIDNADIDNLKNIRDRSDHSSGDMPENLPYIMKRRLKPPYVRKHNHINNRYKSKQTSLPAQVLSPKRISEVHYKEEIQPSEQMNVFADVINNIKNSTRDSDVEFPDAQGVAVKVTAYKRYKRRKLPRRRYKTKATTTLPIEVTTKGILNAFYSTSTENTPSYRIPIGYKNKSQYNKMSVDFLPGPSSQQILIDEEFDATDSVHRQNIDKSEATVHNSKLGNKKYRSPSVWTPMTTNQAEKEHDLVIKIAEKQIPTATMARPTGKERLNPLYSNHRLEEDFGVSEEPDRVYGLVPPRETRYQQTNRPFTSPALETAANSYIVIGMKPPPIKYSFVNDQSVNHVKKRRVTYPYRRRIVRSTRRGYAEIKRDSTKTEGDSKDDDYVPHRPKTFHYDVENGRIVYDKKQESEEEDEEEGPENYEHVDVVEEDTPSSSTKKVKEEERVLKFPSKPPDGPTYIDFVKQLKNDPNYHEILDPKPTEKSTTTSTANTRPSTQVPEFLSILTQVRSDKDYKPLEDKGKPETTAPPEEDDLLDIEEEEGVLRDVQNSSGGQVTNSDNLQLQIFDISEYLPKVKHYNPKTAVDTSKYKSIERVTIIRHNISSKYNMEEYVPSEQSKLPTQPITTTINKHRNYEKDDRESVGETSNVSQTTPEDQLDFITLTTTPAAISPSIASTQRTEGTTDKKLITSRGRRRSTTTQSAVSNSTETTTKASVRRQRARGRFKTTTLSPADQTQATTRTRRNLQRRHENSVPKNHKSYYSPIETNRILPKNVVVKIRAKKTATPRAITVDTINKTDISSLSKINTTKSEKEEPKKVKDVDVFKKYDGTQQHGGNYKYKEIEINVSQQNNYKPPTAYEIEESDEIKRLTDVVPKPFAFYSDPKLPIRINRLSDSNNERAAEKTNRHESKTENDFYDDVVQVQFNEEAITKKPLFIKDPSKRLYFYAPV